MRHRVAGAIASVGHSVLVKFEGQSASILVSLQPDFTRERDLSGPQGFGSGARYQLYHGWGANTHLLVEQAEITHGHRKFVVERIDDFYYGSTPIYRKARLLLVEQ